MHQHGIKNILNQLEVQRGFDFSGYRSSMLERRIQKRIYANSCNNIDEYLVFLNQHSEELDNLIDVFTINVSRFFRNSLEWEYTRKILIPDLIYNKEQTNDTNLRIWSAGCSFGEEPYSIAIILNELVKKNTFPLNHSIFATDLDKKALDVASKGIYNYNSIREVKYGIYKSYFTKNGDNYTLDPIIRNMVKFSFYDLLDKKHMVPPESIYSGFDIVFCRNVLIYFNLEYQKIIFNKLYRSLNPNGYIVLGDSEVPGEEFKHKLRRENNFTKIYKKIA